MLNFNSVFVSGAGLMGVGVCFPKFRCMQVSVVSIYNILGWL